MVTSPGLTTLSERRVPEFRMVMSARTAARMRSATRLPTAVSLVRMREKRPSSVVRVVPSTASNLAMTSCPYLSTISSTSGSGVSLAERCFRDVVTRTRRA